MLCFECNGKDSLEHYGTCVHQWRAFSRKFRKSIFPLDLNRFLGLHAESVDDEIRCTCNMYAVRNATNFVFMNLEDFKPAKKPKLEAIDQQFLNKLNDLITICTKSFEKYEYSRVKSEVDKFFWNTFAANYLEIVKKRVYQGSGNKRLSAQYTLYHSLLTILKLLAPIMPFITEEIYQTHFKKNEKTPSIHLENWPKNENSKDSNDLDLLIKLVTKVRQEKSEKQKPMNSEILLTMPKEDKEKLKDMLQDLTDVTNAQNIIEGKFKVEVL